MSFYRNCEGYSDPGAGEALSNIARENRRARRLERIQAREDYERLCRQFRRTAEENGFEFPGQIWLKEIKTGRIFKNG